MQIFLDDEREPVNSLDWVIVRDYAEFISAVMANWDEIDFISFDHDLGPDSLTGLDCVKFLIEFDETRRGRVLPPSFKYYVHSQNPIGKANIEGLMDGYMKFKFGE